MRRKTIVLFLGVSAAMLLGGCGSKLDVDTNTIALQKGGKVLEAAVEDFSQSYYDEEELKSYIQNTVDDYASENGKKSVTVSESKVEGEKAYLTLKYESTDVFSDFTGTECFSGSILQAQSAGYEFDTAFYPVTDGSAQDETVPAEDVLKDDDLKAFIVRGNSDIIVPGKIAYVSKEGTKVTAKDTVTVKQKESDTDEAILVYVLYK